MLSRIACIAVSCVSTAVTFADRLPVVPVGVATDYALDSGAWSNSGADFATLFSDEVSLPHAAWLRLYFDEVQLDGGSFVRMTSMTDGEQQALDAGGLALWSNSSAYFNGDRVLLELVVAPGATARVSLGRAAYEAAQDVPGQSGMTRGEPGTCGICSADDRALSDLDSACRLMPAGCSATVYTSNSCLVSAGHCAVDGLVAQFRVPASLADCTVVNPPVADQFPVLGFDFQNAGLGADWSVMTTGPNNLGQKAFQRYGKLRRIAPAFASAGDPVNIWGFGMDATCTRNRVQQQSVGSIVSRSGSYYFFNADIHVGSSGSGVTKDGRIIAVVTHCSPNCPNAGTRVDQANFVA